MRLNTTAIVKRKNSGRIALALMAALGPWLEAQAWRTVSDGVYTQEQAIRGATAYADNCASCHGGDMSGGDFAPDLIGEVFAQHWGSKDLSDLFAKVHTMPPDRPGALGGEAYADIVAFVLKTNGYPAGPKPMSTDPAVLKLITFKKPA